ncbi:MAG: ubiquitin-like small modifier protein 1 [Anaerolineales bacterium]
MPVLKISPLMRYYIDNQTEAVVQGATVIEALNSAVEKYPALKAQVFDSDGKLRRHINVFVNDESIRELKGLKTKLKEEDRVTLLASISGG